MDRDELKQIIQNIPDNSPKLLEYLKEAREKGWTDVIDMIAIKLGLKEEKKKGKKEESEVLKKILRPIGRKKIEHTWDYSVDFLEAKKVLTSAVSSSKELKADEPHAEENGAESGFHPQRN